MPERTPSRLADEPCVIATRRLPADSPLAMLSRAGRAILRRHRAMRAIAWACWIGCVGVGLHALLGGPMGLVFAAAGGVAAVTFGRGPGDVAVLAALDRRLGLHELLASAATLRDEDPAAQIVRDRAEQVARTIDVGGAFHDPRPARSLTTAALALAASVALALTIARPVGSPAVDRSVASLDAAAPGRVERAARPDPESPRSAAATVERTTGETRGSRAGEAARGERDGGGASAGTSAMSPMPTARSSAAVDAAAASRGTAGRAGEGDATAGGSGAGAATAERGRLDLAPADVNRAAPEVDPHSAAAVDRVPAVSRDLVRAFFAPDGEGRP